MDATLYWTIQHLTGRIHDLHFTATCWRLSQSIDFLEWRWRFDPLLPQSRPVPTPVQLQDGGRYAMSSM